MINVFYLDLVGKNWEEIGRCYGLLKELYCRGGINLPDIYQPDEQDRIHQAMVSEEQSLLGTGSIVKLDKPEPWAIAIIQVLAKDYGHMGVVLPGNRTLIHASKKKGVIIEPINRVNRWGNIRCFYRWTN